MRYVFFAPLLLSLAACAANSPPAAPAAPAIATAAANSGGAGAAPTAPASEPQPASAGAVLVTLERTACYGFCPVYRLTVSTTGSVLYEGESFVKVKGHGEAQLDPATLTRLQQAFESAKFASFADSYENQGRTDAPSSVISFNDGKKTKTIRHYHGDPSAPAALSSLEDQVDSIVGIERWIGTQKERSASASSWGR